MSDYATKNDVQEIVDKAVTKAVTDLSEIISNFAQNFYSSLDSTNLELDVQNKKLDNLINDLEAFLEKPNFKWGAGLGFRRSDLLKDVNVV